MHFYVPHMQCLFYPDIHLKSSCKIELVKVTLSKVFMTTEVSIHVTKYHFKEWYLLRNFGEV